MIISQSWRSPIRSHWCQQSLLTGSRAPHPPVVQALTQIILSTLSLSQLVTIPMVFTRMPKKQYCFTFSVAILSKKQSILLRLYCLQWFNRSANFFLSVFLLFGSSLLLHHTYPLLLITFTPISFNHHYNTHALL